MSGSEKPRDASAEEKEKEIRLNFRLGLSILPFGSFLSILLVGFAVYNLVNGTGLLGALLAGGIGCWILIGLSKETTRSVKAYIELKRKKKTENG